MIIYQPWIEWSDNFFGETSNHSFSFHLRKESAESELAKMLAIYKKENIINIVKHGINETEVIE